MPGVPNPSISLNFNYVRDWMPSVYIDQRCAIRGFIDSSYNYIAEDVFDANGWLTAMPAAGEAYGYWDKGSLVQDRYVFEYPTEWTLTIEAQPGSASLGNVDDSTPGVIKFDYITGNVRFRVTDINGGTYTKNLKLYRERFAYLLSIGQRFNPFWLARIQNARAGRFMNWSLTNYRVQTTWADRPTRNDFSYQIKGVPIEDQVELCNLIGCDGEFNIGHLADDNFITQTATYLRDNLREDLVALVEFTNEPWNGKFDPSKDLAAAALADWGQGDAMDKVAENTVRMSKLFDAVYGTTIANRPRHLIGINCQTGNEQEIERVLTGSGWLAALEAQVPSRADEWSDPLNEIDVVLNTGYFGNSTLSSDSYRDELIAMIQANDYDTVADWLESKLLDPTYAKSVTRVAAEAWGECKAMADTYGKQYRMYEGGSHLFYDASGISDATWNDVLRPFLYRFSRGEHMARLLKRSVELWFDGVGDGPYSYFCEHQNWDDTKKNENFSLWHDLEEETATGTYIMGVANEIDAPFATGGDRYLPSVVALARASADVLAGNGKDDVLVGVDPANVATLPGMPEDYTPTMQGDGSITYAGANGTLRVKGCGCVTYRG